MIMNHITEHVALNISQARDNIVDANLLAVFIALVDREPQIAMDAYSQLGAELADAFLYSGAFVMDMYILSTAGVRR